MAKVKILNNSINPIGWKVGDEVEISVEQGLFDLRDRKMIEVLEYSPEEKILIDEANKLREGTPTLKIKNKVRKVK